jgi:hypothetical protein
MRFLRGSCSDFALALAERFPAGQFVALGDARFSEHIGLRVGDVFYDVRGAMTEAEFQAGYPDLPLIDVERNDVTQQCGLASVAPPYKGIPEIAAARRAVRQVFPAGRRS